MTDREKLIELFVESAAMDYKDSAEYFIANGVTFQKWIPVTERLPEVGTGNVLVVRSYRGKPYVDVGEFINGTVCCWGDEYAINPREHITTHWMPLPNPPKEEDK